MLGHFYFFDNMNALKINLSLFCFVKAAFSWDKDIQATNM